MKQQIGSLRNSRKKPPQIRTSHILFGLLGCVIVGTVILFGGSLHFILKNSDRSGASSESGGGHPHDIDSHPHDHPPPKKNLRQSSTLTNGGVSLQAAKTALDKVKTEFYERYGGQAAAEGMLAKTITTFGSIDGTAERILRAVARQEAFVMGFAGYSITVGRGNFFNQSFPFVVDRVLKDSMKAVGVPNFIVRNSAIGGYVC